MQKAVGPVLQGSMSHTVYIGLRFKLLARLYLEQDYFYSADLHAVHLKMDKLLNSEDDR